MDYKAQPGLTDGERLALIEEIVGRTDQRLFGNGQPGELSAIKRRIEKLEQYRWQLAGAFGLALAIFEYMMHKP